MMKKKLEYIRNDPAIICELVLYANTKVALATEISDMKRTRRLPKISISFGPMRKRNMLPNAPRTKRILTVSVGKWFLSKVEFTYKTEP